MAALQAQGFAVWALETTETSERYTDPPRASRASVSAATSPAASAAASYPRKVALVVGNEVTGVAPAALERWVFVAFTERGAGRAHRFTRRACRRVCGFLFCVCKLVLNLVGGLLNLPFAL